MQVQNSYIFLYNKKEKKKPSNKEKNTNIKTLDFPRSVSFYISKTFNLESQANIDSPFKNIFNIVLDNNNKNSNVTFIINSVVDSTYLDVFVEGQTKSQCIKCLEYIQYEIENSGIQSE